MPANLFDTPLFQAAFARVPEPTKKVTAVPLAFQRKYQSAQGSRLNQSNFGASNDSADSELVTDLKALRARSRALVRDAAFAKNARRIIVNNVIGSGVRLQASVKNARGQMHERVNDSIEAAFEAWCAANRCHTGGELHFHSIERMAMGQVFEAGEIFIRMHRSKFGDSKIPLALEVIEPERLMDGFEQPSPGPNVLTNMVRMGVEADSFGRPAAYWVRKYHPGDIRFKVSVVDQFERVPAADMFHLRIIDRWPQTRGEPWMHAVARKLNDMDGYSEAEITAARGAASYLATIKSPESAASFGEEQPDGSVQEPLEPGMVKHLLPGEEFNFVSPNRPNSALDPFMRYMLREVAAGIGVSYESLSRDYGQSNYSSSRLALLDDRDCWRELQMWFIRTFRLRLHKEWLQAAALSRVISAVDVQQYAEDAEKFECALFRPRGWSWVDPTKEVAAYKEAVRAGFMTVTDVINQTNNGMDLQDVMEARADELEYMESLGLTFDTSPELYVPAETGGLMIQGESGAEQVKEPAAMAAKPAVEQPDHANSDDSEAAKPARTLRAVRKLGR